MVKTRSEECSLLGRVLVALTVASPDGATASGAAGRSISVRVSFKGGDDFTVELALEPRASCSARLLALVESKSGVPTGRARLMVKRLWKGALRHSVDLASLLEARAVDKPLCVKLHGVPASAADLFAALRRGVDARLAAGLPPRPRTARDRELGWGIDWVIETRRLAPSLSAALKLCSATSISSELTRFSAEQLIYKIEMSIRDSGEYQLQQTQQDAWMPISVHTRVCAFLPRGSRARLLRRCMVLSRRWNRAAGQRMFWRSILETGWRLTPGRLDAIFPKALLRQAGSLNKFIADDAAQAASMGAVSAADAERAAQRAKQRAIDGQRWSQDYANVYLLARRSVGAAPSMLGTLHAVFVAAIFRRLRPGAEGGAAAPAMRIEIGYPPKYRDALARARATTTEAAQRRAGAGAGRRATPRPPGAALVLDTAQPVVYRWRSAVAGEGETPLVSLRFIVAPSTESVGGATDAAFATPSENIVPLEGRGQLSALGCSRLAFVVDDAAQHAAQRAAAARRVKAWAAADKEADEVNPFVVGAPVIYTRYADGASSATGLATGLRGAAAGGEERAAEELAELIRRPRDEARALLARAEGDITRGVQLFFSEGGVVVRSGGEESAGGAAALETAPADEHWECGNCQCIYGPGFAAPVTTEVCGTCGEDSRDEALRRGLSRTARSLIEAASLRRVRLRVAARGGAAPAVPAAPAAAAAPRAEERIAATVIAVHRDAGECSFMYRYILRESCSQFDLLPLTSLTISCDVPIAMQASGTSQSASTTERERVERCRR